MQFTTTFKLLANKANQISSIGHNGSSVLKMHFKLAIIQDWSTDTWVTDPPITVDNIPAFIGFKLLLTRWLNENSGIRMLA